uniref:PROP1-like PPR domain-containing protein n=1 Tax=Kalanchoe fedtschenkoi TaxID=63787 RepID=A0A7N0VCU8_KALFE
MSFPACASPPPLASTPPPKQLINSPNPHSHNASPSQPPNVSFRKKPSTTSSDFSHRKADKPARHQPIHPTVLWTSSIARRCRAGQLDEAVSEFTAMRLAGVPPNHITFVTLFSACAGSKLPGRRFGSSVHGVVRKMGLDVGNVMVGTAAVDMYAKCGEVDVARKLFDEMLVRNNVSWNTMINGYMRSGHFEDAVDLFDAMPDRDAVSWTALINGFVKNEHFQQALVWFREMQMSGVEPDYVTVISVLAACANLGMLGLGLWLHRFILKHDFRDNIKVNNSLIDMYSRCGCIEYARQVFQSMNMRSLVSWNSITVGFAVNGHASEALRFFDLMQKEGFEPDEVSLTGALTACSHAGFVDKGIQLYQNMKKIHKITPRIEHYGCIVDLYSRAGRLEEALDIIENMPMKPNEVVLGSLLAACRTREDLKLAERVQKHLVKLDPSTDSNYVLLSNIYAAVGEWSGATEGWSSIFEATTVPTDRSDSDQHHSSWLIHIACFQPLFNRALSFHLQRRLC